MCSLMYVCVFYTNCHSISSSFPLVGRISETVFVRHDSLAQSGYLRPCPSSAWSLSEEELVRLLH